MKTLNLACCVGFGLIGSLVLLHWKDPRYRMHETASVPAQLPAETVAALIKPEGSVIQPLLISKKTVKIPVREVRISRTSAGTLQPSVIRFNENRVPQKARTQLLIKKIDEQASALPGISTVSPAMEATDAIAYGTATQEQELAPNEHNPGASFGPAAPAVLTATTVQEDAPTAHEAVYPTAAEADKPVARTRAVYVPSYVATTHTETGTESYSYMALYQKAEELKTYAQKNGYDTAYAFLVNLGMKSGRKRFFVMDLGNMTIIKTGIVAHGRGDSRFTFNKSYSNKPGSNCSSLGIFKVGKFYEGSFGPAYRLFGLENTNSNAYGRSIVLHAMNCIPYDESDYPVCQSEGCPSLSPQFFKEIRHIIDESDKPMLMCVYDPAAENQ